jgi:hypothetical protein
MTMDIIKRMYSLVAIFTVFLAVWPAETQQSQKLTKEEMHQFLLTADIIESEEIGKGVTHSQRLTLSDGIQTHRAAFQDIDIRTTEARFKTGGGEVNFVDSYHFNIAAYQLAELLGIEDMIPVTVEREWRGKKGSLSWWIDAKLDAAERLEKDIMPPDTHAWNVQMHKVRVFSQLVYDTDRNLSNVLITEDWKLWMIDFTRAFRTVKKLQDKKEIFKCDRNLFSRLQQLSKPDVEHALGDHLTMWEIDALMARRDRIVDHFKKLIDAKGEAEVLY